MESAISSIILFTVGIFAAMTISYTFLENQDALWTSEQTRQEAIVERERTAVEITNATTQGVGQYIRVTLRNNGQVKLADFERWDVVVQYYSDPLFEYGEPVIEEAPDIYNVAWLPYAEGTLAHGQWTVSGIYVDANTMMQEAFESGILNPDEEMVLQVHISPTVAMTTTNLITINTPNGVSTSAHFIR